MVNAESPNQAAWRPPAPQSTLRLCAELFRCFLKISLFSFGGGMAMIPFFHRELVARHRWLGEEEFVDAVGLSLAVPGPIATNIAVIVGRKTGGAAGVASALLGMVIPPLLLAVLVALVLRHYAGSPIAAAFLKGAGAAVVGLIAYGAFIIGRRIVTAAHTIVVGVALAAAVILLNANPLLALLAATAIEGVFIFIGNRRGNPA